MKAFLIILCFATAFSCIGQSPTYKNLVLEGGGVKGFAYAGAFEVLDSLGFIKNIERVGGSSVGAIQATLLAIGYTPAEMMVIAEDIPLKKFNDGFFPGGISRLKNKYGFFKGKRITKWVEELIATKTGDADITFMQLHQQRVQKKYKDLYITGTDITNRCLRIFSYETYPHMKIKDALRISFSIPLYFEPVLIDDNGKVYKQDKNNQYHVMVDGGLVSNYPIHIFDDEKYKNADGSNFNTKNKNKETLGLLLERPEYMGYVSGKTGYALPVNSLLDYLTGLYQTVVDRPNPDDTLLIRTINISHFGISGRVRKLPRSLILKLVESGRQGVRDFFAAKR